MTTTTDVLAALDAEGSTSWQIADALAEFDEVGDDGKPLTLKMLGARIWDERGVEWSPASLGKYRATAIAFPSSSDSAIRSAHSFSVCLELRAHPDKLRAWQPKRQGDVLTQERARAIRGGTASTPKPDAWKAQAKRAFGVIANVAEHDPAFILDMLEQTITTVRRVHGRQLEKAERALRAV